MGASYIHQDFLMYSCQLLQVKKACSKTLEYIHQQDTDKEEVRLAYLVYLPIATELPSPRAFPIEEDLSVNDY